MSSLRAPCQRRVRCEIRYDEAAGRWVLLATVLGSGLAMLDATVVNVCLAALGLGGARPRRAYTHCFVCPVDGPRAETLQADRTIG